MAKGVPLVSTRVGMAPDVISSGCNGLLADVEDVQGLVEHASSLIDNPSLRPLLAARGIETAQSYDWIAVARILYDTVYSPLLGRP